MIKCQKSWRKEKKSQVPNKMTGSLEHQEFCLLDLSKTSPSAVAFSSSLVGMPGRLHGRQEERNVAQGARSIGKASRSREEERLIRVMAAG